MTEWIAENYKWLFSGIGIFILGGLAHLINARKQTLQESQHSINNHQAERELSSVVSADHTVINGAVAGRDIAINNLSPDICTDELISVLQLRAGNIQEQLLLHYHYAPVKKYLSKFEQLHLQHLAALEKGNLVLAHEILIAIYALSGDLEQDEFWKRHNAESPSLQYSLSPDMFQKGILICRYLFGDEPPNWKFYPREITFWPPQKLNTINALYKKIVRPQYRKN